MSGQGVACTTVLCLVSAPLDPRHAISGFFGKFCGKITMDGFSIGTAIADEFDNANKLVYSASAGAFARFANSPISKPLSNDCDPRVDQIVFVSFDKDKGILGAKKALIAALFHDWNIPKVAISHLFDPRPVQGFFDVVADSIRCCWYHVPVERLDNATGELKYSMLHVWQVLKADKSRVRVLVLYPPNMKADFIAVLPSFFTATIGQDWLQWHQIHLILMQTAIESWQKTRWIMMSLGSVKV